MVIEISVSCGGGSCAVCSSRCEVKGCSHGKDQELDKDLGHTQGPSTRQAPPPKGSTAGDQHSNH